MIALLFALAAGALWGLCFGEEGMLLAPWVVLAPLPLLLGHRRAALLGFAHGAAFWLTSLSWIAGVLTGYGGMPGWLAAVSLLLLVIYLALYTAAFAFLGRWVWQRGSLVALPVLPALWVLLEVLRGWLFEGFPWNLAAYAWVEVPGALPLSAWAGAWGISYAVVFANTGVALAIVRRRPAVAAVAVLVCLTALAAAGRWSNGEPVHTPRLPAPVRILQPNIPNQVDPDPETLAANYDKVIRASRELCRPGALIVWPESAAWPLRYLPGGRLAGDVAELNRQGCALLFNSTHAADEGYYNSAYLVEPGGGSGRYDKRKLVPFGEYVPLAGVFTFIDQLARNAGAFTAGEEPSLLAWGPERLGLAICFEVTFPEEVAEMVREGATILVTITNDAWFGDTAAPWQHLRAARFRAAESRRPMLRAAITGVSAVIAADGSMVKDLGLFEEGSLAVRILGRRDLSPASRRPWLVPGLCLLAAASSIILIVRRRRTGADP